jgi:hypothetical protein
VWSEGHQPASSTIAGYASDKPSTSDNQVGSKKGKVKFPCLLCKEMHHNYLCLRMDEASYLLEKIVDAQQQVLSSNPPFVDELVNLVPSSVKLVDQVVHMVQSSVESADQVIGLISTLIDPTLPLESEVKVVDPIPILVDPATPRKCENVAHVFLVSTNSFGIGSTSLIPTEPPSSDDVILLDWVAVPKYCLPFYIPFQIIVQVCGRDGPQTIVDEGASVSIFSSIAWQALVFPLLVLVTQNLLSFNRRITEPLRILCWITERGGELIMRNYTIY